MEMTEKEKEHQAMRNLLTKKQMKIDELTKEVKKPTSYCTK